ncbi:oligopeptide transport system substrate-binding protein [Scopulibacillus darangshiensis]|uniref:Oligopeptide transport system substrate-binding protein n=1 Tax=Scopulibacillus darangshiensis TaxID=442528 RepID=A0A4R2P4K3_9BACL|nr:peptide ABC transporter substrate-binding protein [Scopulibacillus darangshiensis]TCP29749.1 oligopeptide transport system substrate-binding protein [Scopulibacillus darangshiensis]
MRGKAKWSVLLAVVLVMSLFLSACSSSSSGDKKKSDGKSGGSDGDYKQVLNLAESEEIPTLDTKVGDDEVSFNVFQAIYEGLYTMNSKNEIVPALATGDPEIKKDGDNFNYTFKLRENAKWSNGDPVTANDFVYAWHSVVAKDSKAPYSYLFPTLGILNADKILNPDDPMYGKVDKLGVKAVDDHTLQVTLTKEVPYYKSLLQFPTFFPQNQKFREAEGKKYGLEVDNAIYNGPFVLDKWEHNKGWVFKKNPNYWDKDNVSLDQVNIKVVKELTTTINLYNSGQVDRVGLTGEWVDKYKDRKDFKTYPGTSVYYLKFNQKNKYLKNVNIRRAIAMSFDKDAYVTKLLKNGSKAADFLVPGGFTKGPDGKDFRDANGDLISYDPAKAKEYWKKGKKELGVDKIDLEFLAYDGPDYKNRAVFMKNQMEKNLPGLKVTIKQQPFKVMLDLEDNLKYDFVSAGWGPDYQDPMTFLDMFVTGNGNNQMAYSDKKYDEKIKFAKEHSNDLKARWQAMLDAEKILLKDDAALAPMYQSGSAKLTQPYVKDLVVHPFGPDYTFKYVSVDKH